MSRPVFGTSNMSALVARRRRRTNERGVLQHRASARHPPPPWRLWRRGVLRLGGPAAQGGRVLRCVMYALMCHVRVRRHAPWRPPSPPVPVPIAVTALRLGHPGTRGGDRTGLAPPRDSSVCTGAEPDGAATRVVTIRALTTSGNRNTAGAANGQASAPVCVGRVRPRASRTLGAGTYAFGHLRELPPRQVGQRDRPRRFPDTAHRPRRHGEMVRAGHDRTGARTLLLSHGGKEARGSDRLHT